MMILVLVKAVYNHVRLGDDNMGLESKTGLKNVGNDMKILEIFPGFIIPSSGILIHSMLDSDIIVMEASGGNTERELVKKTAENCNNDSSLSDQDTPSPIILGGSRVIKGEGRMIIRKVDSKDTPQKKIFKQFKGYSRDKLKDYITVVGIRILLLSFTTTLMMLIIGVVYFDTIHKNLGFLVYLIRLISFFVTICCLFLSENFLEIFKRKRKILTRNCLKDAEIKNPENFEILGYSDVMLLEYQVLFDQEKMVVSGFWNFGFRNLDGNVDENLLKIENFEIKKNLRKISESVLQLGLDSDGFSQIDNAIGEYVENFIPGGNDVEFQIEMVGGNVALYSACLEADDTKIWVLRGKPTNILERCTTMLNLKNGQELELSDEKKQEIIQESEIFLQDGNSQIVSLAYKTTSDDSNMLKEDQDFTFFGFLFAKKKLRKNSKFVLKSLNDSGINVVLFTDSSSLETLGSMRNLGFFKNRDNESGLTTVDDFLNRTEGGKQDEEDLQGFEKFTKNLKMFTGARFDNINTLVTRFKEYGKIITLSGSNLSYAEAMKKSDFSIFLRKSDQRDSDHDFDTSTPNNNLSGVIECLKRSRELAAYCSYYYENYVFFSLIISTYIVLGALLMGEYILSPLQISWIFWIFEISLETILTTSNNTGNLLGRGPYSVNDSLLSKSTKTKIASNYLFQLILTIGIISSGRAIFPNIHKQHKNPNRIISPSALNNYFFNIAALASIANTLSLSLIRSKKDSLEPNGHTVKNTIILIFTQIVFGSFGGYFTGISDIGIGYKGWMVCVSICFICSIWHMAMTSLASEKNIEELEEELNAALQTEIDTEVSRIANSFRTEGNFIN